MFKFRLYDKGLDIDLDDWSKEDYSNYYNDIHKYALFNESISEVYNTYIEHPDQMGSIFDKVVVVLDNNVKIAVIVINYFLNELDGKKVLGINPILVNPKYINKGYGKKIIKTLIDLKGMIFDMMPDKMYAGIDNSNKRCKHVFESLGFKLVGKADDDFFYYELELIS